MESHSSGWTEYPNRNITFSEQCWFRYQIDWRPFISRALSTRLFSSTTGRGWPVMMMMNGQNIPPVRCILISISRERLNWFPKINSLLYLVWFGIFQNIITRAQYFFSWSGQMDGRNTSFCGKYWDSPSRSPWPHSQMTSNHWKLKTRSFPRLQVRWPYGNL